MVRVLLLLIFAVSARAAEVDDRFQQANHLYEEGDVAGAQRIYQSLAAEGNYSSQLFYNLGNTFYRQEKFGNAAVNYERALALNPGHAEAKANLRLVRDKTGGKIGRSSWRDYVFLELNRSVYAIAASVAGWLAVFALAALPFARGSRVLLWALVLVGLVIAGYGIAGSIHFAQAERLAVVTAKQSPARVAPADTAAIVEPLPAASRVWILVERGEWVYVLLPAQGRGWIPAAAIEKIMPQQT